MIILSHSKEEGAKLSRIDIEFLESSFNRGVWFDTLELHGISMCH